MGNDGRSRICPAAPVDGSCRRSYLLGMVRVLAFCVLLFPAYDAVGAQVEIPLRVSLDTLRDAFNAQLTGYRDGPCRYLRLKPAGLESKDGRLHLAIPGRGALGVPFAGACQTAATWQGVMHFTLAPRIDAAGRVRVRIVDSRASGIAPAMWEMGKQHLHARLARFGYDIDLSLLSAAAPGLPKLELGQPRVEASHVVLPVGAEIPDAWLATPAASSAPLTEAELEALEKALEPFDAFLVHVIRHVAEAQDEELRKRLFTVLLDSRYRLVDLLSGDVRAEGDAARAMFLETWSELREALAGRYTLFVDAADALAALEGAAPGLALSTDGLRQLARTLTPGVGADPLAYDWSVDPQLGAVFGVEEIDDTPAAQPPTRSWLDFLVPRAYADDSLERWVPTRAELPEYQARIGGLLKKVSKSGLPAPYDGIYAHLVPTTALIESCWRQYVVRGGKVSYLRSQSASVGIMQINQRVWRGFYDIQRVRWDTAYNIRAGAQILLRYMKDYAIPYAEKAGEPEYAPRAAYAVYNAGPRAVGRFAKSPPHPREARVDEKLWALYRGIAGGADVDLASCGVVKPGRSSAARAQ